MPSLEQQKVQLGKTREQHINKHNNKDKQNPDEDKTN